MDVMNYALFVTKNLTKFDSQKLLKIANDLAVLLDHQILEVKPEKIHKAEMREEVFHDFCAICAKADVPVPELETILYEAHLPKTDAGDVEAHRKKMNLLTAHIQSQLHDDSDDKKQIMSFIAVLAAFPSFYSRFGGVTGKQIEAFINNLLVSLGKKNMRPNYNNREVETAVSQIGPRELAKLLIFDDSENEIVRTARALVGWENIEMEFLQYDTSDSYGELRGESLDAELKKMAGVILSMKPKIVLMDQGLIKIKGSDLTSVLIGMPNAPIVVANTGGSDDKLCKAGALANCNKGSDLRGVKEAIRML